MPRLDSKESLFITACSALLLATLGCSDSGEVKPPLITGVWMAVPPDYVQVDFQAQVTVVIDPFSDLGGAVTPGDVMLAAYRYDESAADSRPQPDEGRYSFNSPRFGIEVNTETLTFRSDPSGLDMTIRLQNDVARDACRVSSVSNLDVLSGLGVLEIGIDLRDNTATALSSDALIGLEADLSVWSSRAEVTILGDNGWEIRADITSFTEVPYVIKKAQEDIKLRFHEG